MLFNRGSFTVASLTALVALGGCASAVDDARSSAQALELDDALDSSSDEARDRDEAAPPPEHDERAPRESGPGGEAIGGPGYDGEMLGPGGEAIGPGGEAIGGPGYDGEMLGPGGEMLGGPGYAPGGPGYVGGGYGPGGPGYVGGGYGPGGPGYVGGGYGPGGPGYIGGGYGPGGPGYVGGGYGPGGPGYIGGGYGPGGPGYVVGGPGYVEGCDAYGNCFSRRAWGYGMSSAYRSSTGSSCNAFGCVYW